MRILIIYLLIFLSVAGCGVVPLYAYTNKSYEGAEPVTTASSVVDPAHRGRKDTLVIMALSGGGSRSAYFAGKVMLELEKLGLLQEVDAISSISGGSLPAAYYAVSKDSKQEAGDYRLWNEEKVLNAMSKNYLLRWFGRWFLPQNALRFWFTKYDRTDIMAKTFANSLLDKPFSGRDYKLGDLNPQRPNIVLSATNATKGRVSQQQTSDYSKAKSQRVQNINVSDRHFGQPFHFTKQDFKDINSDILDYSLARAVMATATFPAVFNYMTLRDFSTDDKDNRYLHVFDGGNHDNQALSGVAEILEDSKDFAYDKLIVILGDAYTGTGGVDASRSDGRDFLDYFVDSNFVDATDSLLFANREQRTKSFYDEIFSKYLRDDDPNTKDKVGIYYHIQFKDIGNREVRRAAQNVPTSFSLSKAGATALQNAATALMQEENTCLQGIRELLATGRLTVAENCVYQTP